MWRKIPRKIVVGKLFSMKKKRNKWNVEYVVLLLKKAIYGTKQAAMAFWRELLECMYDMGYERSKANPCMYYKWNNTGLTIWISWIDDCMIWGNSTNILEEKTDFLRRRR